MIGNVFGAVEVRGVMHEVLFPDGMMLCEGCDRFVLGGVCGECLRIADAFEAKRLEEKRFLESYERRDVGLVPYEPGEPYSAREAFAELPGKIQLVLFAGACGSASVALFVIWSLVKAAVWFALEMSR